MKGHLIVLEGTDGSGKGTQLALLYKNLLKHGYDVEKFDFPRYGQASAFFVEQYLNGAYGSLADVGPYKGSLFYAMDRFAASFDILAALRRGKIVLANRYTASNMGHQGAKFKAAKDRAEYFKWLDNLEHEILGIPRPDLNIVLHVPPRLAQQLVDKKAARAYLKDAKRDLHEADLSHLKRAEQVYLQMSKLFPENFAVVTCVQNNLLLSRQAVAAEIWQEVSLLLARQPVIAKTNKGKKSARSKK